MQRLDPVPAAIDREAPLTEMLGHGTREGEVVSGEKDTHRDPVMWRSLGIPALNPT